MDLFEIIDIDAEIVDLSKPLTRRAATWEKVTFVGTVIPIGKTDTHYLFKWGSYGAFHCLSGQDVAMQLCNTQKKLLDPINPLNGWVVVRVVPATSTKSYKTAIYRSNRPTNGLPFTSYVDADRRAQELRVEYPLDQISIVELKIIETVSGPHKEKGKRHGAV